MRAVILGADGQLGRELALSAPAGVDVTALGRGELDITRAEEVRERLAALHPQVVINAAAYTEVDRAEDEPDAAFAVNADGAGHVARAAAALEARLIHISTDFVFDGAQGSPYRPDAAPRPLGVYGRSKLDGERQVAAATAERATIVRTAWLHSVHGKNFVTRMLQLMRDRSEVRVVADQVGTPTWARPLSDAVWTAAARELPGRWHWTDAGVASWYDFAVAVHEEALSLGLLDHPVAVEPIRTEDYPTRATRPAYSVLDKSGTWAALGMTSRHWRLTLRAMLRQLAAHAPSSVGRG